LKKEQFAQQQQLAYTLTILEYTGGEFSKSCAHTENLMSVGMTAVCDCLFPSVSFSATAAAAAAAATAAKDKHPKNNIVVL